MSQEELQLLKNDGFYFANQSGVSTGDVTAADEQKQRQLFCDKIKLVLCAGHLKNDKNKHCLLRQTYLPKDLFWLILSFAFGDKRWKYADGPFPLFWPISPDYKCVSLVDYVKFTNREGFLKTLEYMGVPKKPLPVVADNGEAEDDRRVGRCRVMGLTRFHKVEFMTVTGTTRKTRRLAPHPYISARRFSKEELEEMRRTMMVYIDGDTDFQIVFERGRVFANSLYMVISNLQTGQRTVIFYSSIYLKAVVGHSHPWKPEFFEVFLNTRQRQEWEKLDPCDRNNKVFKEQEISDWVQKNLDTNPKITNLLFKESSNGELDEFHSNEVRDFRYGVFRYSPALNKLTLLPFQDINSLRRFDGQQMVGSVQHGMVTFKPIIKKQLGRKALTQKRKNIKRTYLPTSCFHRRDRD